MWTGLRSHPLRLAPPRKAGLSSALPQSLWFAKCYTYYGVWFRAYITYSYDLPFLGIPFYFNLYAVRFRYRQVDPIKLSLQV